MNPGLVKSEETSKVDMPNLVTNLDRTPKYVVEWYVVGCGWTWLQGHIPKATCVCKRVV